MNRASDGRHFTEAEDAGFERARGSPQHAFQVCFLGFMKGQRRL
jgi:hypothetical protein